MMSSANRANTGRKRTGESSVALPHMGKPGETLGLRDRKKAQQRLDLIEVAVKLFKKRGYEAVRMEDIASKADVSTKTVYNYFPTKRDILIEFLVADRERAISEFRKVIETPAGNPIDDLIRLMEADIGDVLLPGERALWLEIMAVTVRERGDERFRRYRHMFTSYFETSLSHFQEAGKISPSLNVALAAHIIHIVHSENFEHFCMEPSLTVEGALSSARAQLDLLFKAWADDKAAAGARKARK